MPETSLLKKLFLSLVLLAGSVTAVEAKKLYRWIDEDGSVYFSDQVPPDQVQHKRETLNEKARVLDIVEKAKTPEQLEQQKRLDSLRREQEKIIAKQAAYDKVLLATYRSLDDMKRAMDNKFAAIDVERKITEGNLKRAEQQLQQQQLQAAEYERNARKLPPKLLDDIAASKRQIEQTKQELERQGLNRVASEREFKSDMARFVFLTQGGPAGDKANQGNLAVNNANNDLGLFVCQDVAQCDKAWQVAGEFVAKYSTTGEDVANERLIMRATPFQDTDISLSVSKLERDGQLQIFLDIRCKQSAIGKELCAGDNVQAIRRSFAPYLQSRFTAQ